jgi:hypothetical protein
MTQFPIHVALKLNLPINRQCAPHRLAGMGILVGLDKVAM